jgi:hypothetical protein
MSYMVMLLKRIDGVSVTAGLRLAGFPRRWVLGSAASEGDSILGRGLRGAGG